MRRAPAIKEKEGRFSNAVGTNQTDHARFRKAQIDVVESQNAPVFLDHIFEASGAVGADVSHGLDLQPGGPFDLGIGAHVGHARQSASNQSSMRLGSVGIDANPNAEHQLVAFRLRLDHFGRELRLIGDECDVCRNGSVWISVKHDPCVVADLYMAGRKCRQVDVHIDVPDVEHGEDPAASRKYLAGIGDTISDPAIARRDERVVGDFTLQFRIVVGRVERVLSFCYAFLRGQLAGYRPLKRLLTLVEDFLRHPAILQQRLGSIHLLLGENDLRVRLIGVGTGFGDCPFCRLCLRLRFLQGRLQIARIHDGNDLAARDPVAFIDSQFENTPGELRCDIDRIGLNTAVAGGNADRKHGSLISHQ